MEIVAPPIPVNRYIHEFGAVLGGAGAKTVKAQGKLIIFTGVVGVFPAGIKLAENQLPIVLLFLGIIIHRDTPAKILHGNGTIHVPDNPDHFAVALAGFVNRVGQYFEKGVGTAVQAIGSENNRRP